MVKKLKAEDITIETIKDLHPTWSDDTCEKELIRFQKEIEEINKQHLKRNKERINDAIASLKDKKEKSYADIVLFSPSSSTLQLQEEKGAINIWRDGELEEIRFSFTYFFDNNRKVFFSFNIEDEKFDLCSNYFDPTTFLITDKISYLLEDKNFDYELIDKIIGKFVKIFRSHKFRNKSGIFE